MTRGRARNAGATFRPEPRALGRRRPAATAPRSRRRRRAANAASRDAGPSTRRRRRARRARGGFVAARRFRAIRYHDIKTRAAPPARSSPPGVRRRSPSTPPAGAKARSKSAGARPRLASPQGAGRLGATLAAPHRSGRRHGARPRRRRDWRAPSAPRTARGEGDGAVVADRGAVPRAAGSAPPWIPPPARREAAASRQPSLEPSEKRDRGRAPSRPAPRRARASTAAPIQKPTVPSEVARDGGAAASSTSPATNGARRGGKSSKKRGTTETFAERRLERRRRSNKRPMLLQLETRRRRTTSRAHAASGCVARSTLGRRVRAESAPRTAAGHRGSSRLRAKTPERALARSRSVPVPVPALVPRVTFVRPRPRRRRRRGTRRTVAAPDGRIPSHSPKEKAAADAPRALASARPGSETLGRRRRRRRSVPRRFSSRGSARRSPRRRRTASRRAPAEKRKRSECAALGAAARRRSSGTRGDPEAAAASAAAWSAAGSPASAKSGGPSPRPPLRATDATTSRARSGKSETSSSATLLPPSPSASFSGSGEEHPSHTGPEKLPNLVAFSRLAATPSPPSA